MTSARRSENRPETETVAQPDQTVSATTSGAAVAYLRASTKDQSIEAQRHAIERAGHQPSRWFTDEGVSGARFDRPGLKALLDYARAGDTVVIYSLSRLGRSTRELLSLVEHFNDAGIALVSLTEAIRTDTPAGRMFLTILSSISTYEREVLVERTRAGLERAASEGRRGGRPRALSEDDLIRARGLLASGASISKVAAEFGVARSTLYRALVVEAS